MIKTSSFQKTATKQIVPKWHSVVEYFCQLYELTCMTKTSSLQKITTKQIVPKLPIVVDYFVQPKHTLYNNVIYLQGIKYIEV
jgi:hypothetical protein